MLSVVHLRKSFSTREERLVAIDDLSFSVADGEFVSIVGPSGCGKTTLLRILAGLAEPDSGRVETTQNGHGFVFQRAGLFPWMSVVDNVAFGIRDRKLDRQERAERAERLLGDVGLTEFRDYLPHQLSGGMQQRVNLARALVSDPRTLFMDEPFGALDAQTRHVLREQLLMLWNRDRKDVVFVTHDIEEALLLSDRVLVMSGRPGRIVEDIVVPLERPRDLSGRGHPDLADLRFHIWELVREQAEAALVIADTTPRAG